MLQSDENSAHTAVCYVESPVELKLLFIASLFLPLFLIVALQGRFVLYIDNRRKATKEPITSSDSGSSQTRKKKKKKKMKNNFTIGRDADLMSPPPPPPLALTLAEALGFNADEPDDEAQSELGRDSRSPNHGPGPKRQLTLGEAMGLAGIRRARKWKVLLIGAVSRMSILSRGDHHPTARNRLGVTERKEGGGRPLISLMKEMDRAEERRKRRRAKNERKGEDRVCHVCRVRNKDAVLVPCGHAYCRVCSREIWINRGSCPVCKSGIVEVLDSF